MKLKEKQALRQAQVAQYRQSGKSAEQWCKAHQVNIHTLRYWATKLNKTAQSSMTPQTRAWVTLAPLDAPSQPRTTGLTLRKGAFALEVESGFDPHLLRQVLHVLQGV